MKTVVKVENRFTFFAKGPQFVLLFVFLWAFLIPQLSYAQNTCLGLFNVNQLNEAPKLKSSEQIFLQLQIFMSRFKPQAMTDSMAASLFQSVKNLISDTTGKRVENKVTADSEIVEQSLQDLANDYQSLGIAIVDRDKKIAGKRNVTYTEYTKPFSVTVKQLMAMGFEVRPEMKENLNQKVTVKIRVRSYGTVDRAKESFGINDIEFAPFTKERAFVELKFADPSYEGAVFKPQMYFNKKYLELLGSPDFLTLYDEIKNETLAHLKVNEKKTLDQSSVEAMLDFLRLAHVEKLNLKIVAINLYERVAKAILINYHSAEDSEYNSDVFGAIEKAELQMTFDKMISLYIPGRKYHIGENNTYYSYGPNQTVSEFKTPTYLAHHLKRAQLAAQVEGRVGLKVTAEQAAELDRLAPGLKEYFKMMNKIIQKRDEAKQLNRGKWGVAMKQVQLEVLSFLESFFIEDATVQ